MGLTDKVYAIGAASLLLVVSIAFGLQEIKLHHELATLNKSLDAEIQCRVGSTCASRALAEAAIGADLVAKARAAALAENTAQNAALQKQAADVARDLAALVTRAEAGSASWQAKYNLALKEPGCDAWAKQRVMCVIP